MGKLQLGGRGDWGVGLIIEVQDQPKATQQTTQFTEDSSDAESDEGGASLIAAYKNLLAVSPHP